MHREIVNASAREKWRPIPLPFKTTIADSSWPPKTSVTQQSSGATQIQPSSQSQATVSSSSTTPAVAATSTSTISYPDDMTGRGAGLASDSLLDESCPSCSYSQVLDCLKELVQGHCPGR